MGSSVSCFKPAQRSSPEHEPAQGLPPPQDQAYANSEPLDDTLGHSFCYLRSSARFLSPTASDLFVSPSHSLRFDDTVPRTRSGPEIGFKAISGAAVSANTATPRTVIPPDGTSEYAPESSNKSGLLNGFESTSSFRALPLQPAPRGAGAGGDVSSGFFMSGPIERGYLSGPLDPSSCPDPSGQVPFSAPLGVSDVRKSKKRTMSEIRKAIYGSLSEKKRRWVVPVLNIGAKKEAHEEEAESETAPKSEADNVEWALGKAGEDRVHVVVSEEQGWLFVGIYDGFNGPDAPEYLMDNLYTAVYKELRGLFWEAEGEDEDESNLNIRGTDTNVGNPPTDTNVGEITADPVQENPSFPSEGETRQHRRRLWEYLAEENAESRLELSVSQSFAFSVNDAIIDANNADSSGSKRWLQVKKMFPWRFGLKEEAKIDNKVSEKEKLINKGGKKRKEGPLDHALVLQAMSRALEVTENAYLDMTDKVLDTSPELALMGSCLLAVLMRDEDVYVMNVGDSRAIVAHFEGEDYSSDIDGIVEEPSCIVEMAKKTSSKTGLRLSAQQLSADHNTSIEEVSLRNLKLLYLQFNGFRV